MFKLIDAQTATGAYTPVLTNEPRRAFQVYVDDTASPSADVKIQVSNERNGPWADLTTFTTLTSASASATATSTAPWLFVRGNVTGVSANGEKITLTMSTAE